MNYITRRGGAKLLAEKGIIVPATGNPPSYQHVANTWQKAVKQGVVDDVMFGGHRGISPEQLFSLYQKHPEVAFGKPGRPSKRKCFYEDDTCRGRRVLVKKTWFCQVHKETK